MGRSSGGSSADIGTHDDEYSHDASEGASKIALLHTPDGTGQNIYVQEESDAPVGGNVGDVWIKAVDGTL
jgi:hypothetical protein